MEIRPATYTDFAAIAHLHSTMLTTGFLSKLGEPFLVELYKAIQKEHGSVVYAIVSSGVVTGFIAGTMNTHRLYKKVLFKHWYRFILPLITFVFNIRAVLKIIETVRYGLMGKEKKETGGTFAELLSIAVDKSSQKNGVGRCLVSELEQFFRNNSIQMYKVVTYSKDETANRFYRSCQFTFHHQFVHHGNTMNEYVKILA